MLGLAIALVAFAVGVLLVVGAPAFVSFLGLHKEWVDLGYYTLLVFGLLLWWYWSRHLQSRFWALVFVMLAVHTGAFACFIRWVMPLSPFYYCFIGPLELGAIAFVMERRGSLHRTTAHRA